MYHIGKIIEVYRPGDKDVVASDSAVQATLRMWDENVLTMLVSPKIAAKVKEGNVVLVDYSPDPSQKVPVPLHTIIKIISGKRAENAWKTYRDVYDRQKRATAQAQQPSQSYIA